MAARVLVVTPTGPDRHDTGRGHPERPERLRAALAGVRDAEQGADVEVRPGRAADDHELRLVHDDAYVRALEEFARAGGGALDPDTVVAPESFDAAREAAGCGLVAIDALRKGEADAGFVVARPPGHHATRRRGQGFCLLNNVAIAATRLAEAQERVLVVDWDVHHGNGTQDIFWDDPAVLYVSTHEWPAYPGTGRSSETGGFGAPGLTVNFPLPAGSTGDVALAAFDEVVDPVVARFAPTWVLVSAGYDAHRADPLAGLAWSAGDYAALAKRVASYVPAGRLLAFLEGGYDLDALQASVTATVLAFAGDTRAEAAQARTSGGPGREQVAMTAAALARVEG